MSWSAESAESAWSVPAGHEGSSSPSKRGELGAMESDLGRGHLSVLERSERVQERE